MAKRRRRRKKSSGYEFEYWNVVAALILIVLPILAFGLGKPLGFVGKYFISALFALKKLRNIESDISVWKVSFSFFQKFPVKGKTFIVR